MEMSGKFVFEILFKTKSNETNRENIFVTIEEESLINFSMFKEDLRKCVLGPFRLRYIDDEEDTVLIDTEEEFKEFVKFARQHSSKGLLIKLIVEERLAETQVKLPFIDVSEDYTFKELKREIKEELRKELLLQMQRCPNEPNDEQTKDYIDYEEDSDGNVVLICEKRKKKLHHKQRKIEKKDKHDESKFDKRLEKLEAKKKKLLEKVEQRFKTASSMKGVLDPKITLPWIISAVTTNRTSVLLDSVQAGTMFYHTWHITNDGTVPLNNVILRHFWSSPGLEPKELSTKCPPLAPGKEGIISMRFKAPVDEVAFVSYWHFFSEIDGKWVQFGHYVDLRGHVKATQKSTLGEDKILNKDKKTVTFADKAEAKNESQVISETFRLPCQMQIDVQRKLEATLASSVIAAEMAREAANVAYRRAVECTCSQSSNSTAPAKDDINENMEKAAESLQKLNISSSSDTDTNMESNEDTDRGFVLVDVPSCYRDDGPAIAENTSIKKDDISQRTHVFTNDMTSLPKEKQSIEEEKKIEGHNDINNKQLVVNSVEPSAITGNINQAYGLYPPIQSNIPKINQYIPQKNVPSSCQNSSPHLVYHSQPLIYPPKVSGFPVPPIPVYSNMPPCSQPLPYPISSPLFTCVPSPYMTSKTNPPTGFVGPIPTMRNLYTNPSINRLPENNIGINNVSKHQASEISAVDALNQPELLANSNNTDTKVVEPTTADLLNAPPIVNSGMLLPPLAPSQVNAPVIQFSPMYPFNPLNTCQYANFNTHVNKPYENNMRMDNASQNQATGYCSNNEIGSKSDINNISGSDNSHKTLPNQSEIELKRSDAVTFIPVNISSGNGQFGLPSPKKVVKESPVQILPQSLVDGAINVASSAYSTAWNAFTHLRPKGDAVEFDPVFENNMALLVEMGFNNLERNARLLKRFNNDVNQVIGAICASGGGDLLID